MIRNTSRGRGYKNDAVPVWTGLNTKSGPALAYSTRSMAILRVFPRGDVFFSPREISARTGSRYQRYIASREPWRSTACWRRGGERFRLGLALLHLGARVAGGIELRREVMPHLEWLIARRVRTPNCTSAVRKPAYRSSWYAARRTCGRSSRSAQPLPLHLGAAGKVLLAWLPEEEAGTLWVPRARARFGSGTLSAESVRL